MTTDIITCDVCDRVISKSRFARHRMSLNCKCTAHIHLNVEYNFFDFEFDNMVGKKANMIYGNFDGGFERTDDEEAQRINLCKPVYDMLKEQYDISYDRINKWARLCNKIILY